MVDKLGTLVFLLQQLVQLLAQAQGGSAITTLPPTISAPTPTVVIEQPIVIKPKITKVSPTEGGAGTRVTLTGEGFSKISNTIYTGMGQVTAKSPDGKKLTFTLPRSALFSEKWLTETASYRLEHYGSRPITFPLGFYVKNEHGTSASAGLFTLEII